MGGARRNNIGTYTTTLKLLKRPDLSDSVLHCIGELCFRVVRKREKLCIRAAHKLNTCSNASQFIRVTDLDMSTCNSINRLS